MGGQGITHSEAYAIDQIGATSAPNTVGHISEEDQHINWTTVTHSRRFIHYIYNDCGNRFNTANETFDYGFHFLPFTNIKQSFYDQDWMDATYMKNQVMVKEFKVDIESFTPIGVEAIVQGGVTKARSEFINQPTMQLLYDQKKETVSLVEPLNAGDDLYDCNGDWKIQEPLTKEQGILKRCIWHFPGFKRGVAGEPLHNGYSEQELNQTFGFNGIYSVLDDFPIQAIGPGGGFSASWNPSPVAYSLVEDQGYFVAKDEFKPIYPLRAFNWVKNRKLLNNPFLFRRRENQTGIIKIQDVPPPIYCKVQHYIGWDGPIHIMGCMSVKYTSTVSFGSQKQRRFVPRMVPEITLDNETRPYNVHYKPRWMPYANIRGFESYEDKVIEIAVAPPKAKKPRKQRQQDDEDPFAQPQSTSR